MPYDQDKKKQVLEAFILTRGNISDTCFYTDIRRDTFKSWCDPSSGAYDRDFATAVADFREGRIDRAESVVWASVEDDESVESAKWILNRLARQRGYGDKSEVSHQGLVAPRILIVMPGNAPGTIDGQGEVVDPDLLGPAGE